MQSDAKCLTLADRPEFKWLSSTGSASICRKKSTGNWLVRYTTVLTVWNRELTSPQKTVHIESEFSGKRKEENSP